MSGVCMRVFILAICGLVLAPVLVAHDASAQGTPPNARTAVAPEPKSGRCPTARSRGESPDDCRTLGAGRLYDWREDSERYKRIARLVDYLFDRFSKLQTEPGYHPKWKEINLAAAVPGWNRFPAMQAKLVAAGLGADKKATVGILTKRFAPDEKAAERRAQPQQ